MFRDSQVTANRRLPQAALGSQALTDVQLRASSSVLLVVSSRVGQAYRRACGQRPLLAAEVHVRSTQQAHHQLSRAPESLLLQSRLSAGRDQAEPF